MRLDIGCGESPRGHVNCDLFKGNTFHRGGAIIDPKKIKNFVQADVHHLPFRDKIFSECSCSHVLEHKGVEPNRAIKEMVRVTSGVIEIEVPHRCADKGRFPMHARLFNVATLEGWLRRKGLSVEAYAIERCFPHRFVCLIKLPWRIRAKIYV